MFDGQQQFAELIPIQPPSTGINAITSLSQMTPTDALYAVNVIMGQAGPTVRPGYQDWCTTIAGLGGVRTIIPVRGAGSAGAQDFLFAATAQGIYNCSSSSNFPTLVYAFSNTGVNAGYVEIDHFTNLNNTVILLLCDEANGYFTFDTSTATWITISPGTGTNQITGADPTTFTSVRVYNNRVWFVQGSSGNAWYLPVAQFYGTVTLFNFGDRFSHGGNLVNLFIFTYGSYLGTYVYLVAISGTGDVIAYTGNDPNSASTWTLSGQWYVGDVPAGRRIASNYGGDLNIICAYGVLQLSSLFFQKDQDSPDLYLTRKIAPAIAADISLYGALNGFTFVEWPSQNSIILTEPIISGVTKQQYCYNLASNSWTIFNGLDWQHAAYWHGTVYAGTSDGRVIKMTGNQDAVALNNTGGMAINFGLLGAYQNNKTLTNKLVDLIKCYFTTDSPVYYQAFVQYDFDLSALNLGSVPYVNAAGSSGWDVGIWDSITWSGGGVAYGQSTTTGANPGMGNWFCIGVVGATKGNTTLVGYGISARPTQSFI